MQALYFGQPMLKSAFLPFQNAFGHFRGPFLSIMYKVIRIPGLSFWHHILLSWYLIQMVQAIKPIFKDLLSC